MKVIEFNIIKTQDSSEIINNEDLGSIGGSAVEQSKICEIQLVNDCIYVSLLVPKDVFDKIKDDKIILVEEYGWWTSLSDERVIVKRTNGDIIIPVKIF